MAAKRLLGWIGLAASKFHAWKDRYGKANEHNGRIPRDHWLTEAETSALLSFQEKFPLEGYRRLAFMAIDDDVAYCAPATVYRVLSKAGRLQRWNGKPSKKGTGFVQPLAPHEHWHIDVSYLNIAGTFHYLCSVLDGASRFLVHWEVREQMTEAEVERIVQRGREKFPGAKPRIISDNGPQFIARDFKEFIRVAGMTHVRTSPYYPQSNGKIERWHRTIKHDAIRKRTPLTKADAQAVVGDFVEHYNGTRLHSAIGYVAPRDFLEGKAKAIQDERDRKLEAARTKRQEARSAMRRNLEPSPDRATTPTTPTSGAATYVT